MPCGRSRRTLIPLLLVCAVVGAACSGVIKKEYEYEEELYLALDGTATLNVNASVPALVALRGMDLPLDPKARVDRARVRALFEGPGVQPPRVSLSRRDGRRFVHVSIDVDDVRQLPRLAPFAWSRYAFTRSADAFEYKQVVGPPAGRAIGAIGWTGDEIVAFRMHIPSKVLFHNTPSRKTERGNILEWEQPLADRLKGVPIDMQVSMAPQTILYSTLMLFGTTIVAAAVTFGLVIWWVARRGGQSADLQSSTRGSSV